MMRLISSIKLTTAALQNVEETGINVERDVDRMFSGEVTESQLIAECLDGADEDRVGGWHDYVSAIVFAASSRAC